MSDNTYAKESEVIGIRIYPDADDRDLNAWAADGFDRDGRYSESVARWQDFETLIQEVDKYIVEFFPHLKESNV